MCKRITLLLCAAGLLALTACGWHLRGSGDETIQLSEINLAANDVYTDLYRTFKQEVERREIRLASDSRAPALLLVDEALSERIISYNTELDPAEKELTLTIYYQLNRVPYHLQDRITFRQDAKRAAANESQQDLLLEQMRRRLCLRILQQVALVNRSPQHSPTSTP